MLKSSYADFVEDWTSLITAAEAHAAEVPEVERLRQALKQQVEAIEAEKARQVESKADRQVRTQTLRAMKEEAKDQAKRLRSFLMGQVGPKSERLTQFGMVPQRKRNRRGAGKPAEVPPPSPSPPAAAPAPAGPPGPEPTSTSR